MPICSRIALGLSILAIAPFVIGLCEYPHISRTTKLVSAAIIVASLACLGHSMTHGRDAGRGTSELGSTLEQRPSSCCSCGSEP